MSADPGGTAESGGTGAAGGSDGNGETNGTGETNGGSDTGLPADEQALLDAFTRLAPQGSLNWHFEDAMRRLSTPDDRSTWIEPWTGLPADLWERGRATKATERVMGDVIKIVAQEMTQYAQHIVDDARRVAPEQTTVFEALRFLAARVERLESMIDPLGIRPGELALPASDHGEWADSVPGWVDTSSGLPVVVGELGGRAVVDALVAAGDAVDAVDPRAVEAWRADGAPNGRVAIVIDDVVDHLTHLEAASRSGVVLSGCIDRVSLAGKVDLVDAALRVLVPGGTVVLLVWDQSAWDAVIDPPVRDLLPGRPLHPSTWSIVLSHRGVDGAVVHTASSGTVHAVVARRSQ